MSREVAKQGTQQWKDERAKRITASIVGIIVGHSQFKTREDFILEFIGQKEPEPMTAQGLSNVAHGNRWEDYARKLYCRQYNFIVEEMGLRVSLKDDRIGASVDGKLVGHNTIIEIKCPVGGIYRLLKEHVARLATGWIPDKYYHAHIFDTHYDQMQMGMAVTETTNCHYIVYSASSGEMFVCDVPFNQEYWNWLYAEICKFFDEANSRRIQ
jgi:putative phage-type endonuclease